MTDNRSGEEQEARQAKAGAAGDRGDETYEAGRGSGDIRTRADLRREIRAMPGEILRDFAAEVWSWTVILFFWAVCTAAGGWIGYSIGGGRDSMWIGIAAAAAVSPILLAVLISFDMPRKVWRRMRGKR
ncbi:hypothetical protein [Saccharibacillus deserti]|uniref:hypothetical protein n=1 Tax=Saccharibacillus deserti TaxID=1634444 RepID=UPI0015582FB6|nr:hypothetical protein [Saccharibacillus deserti]